MSTTLSVGGAGVNLPAGAVLGTLTAFTREGYPSLSFYVRSGKLPATPDPYLAKEVVLTVGGTVVFRGDVASAHPEFQSGLGWVTAYSCHGSGARLERIPYTNEADGTGSAGYNLAPEDPSYNASRAGRTVGQILTDVISAKTNGDNLTSKSVGNLVWNAGTSVYDLPAHTVSDLAALTRIPNGPVSVSGEKMWHALAGFVSEHAPNHLLHVEPGGDIRVLDLRTFTNHTFTLGTDPVLPSELSRDCGASFPRVLVRGAPIAVMALLKLSDGTLTEDFAWGSFTNATAKTAWTPGQFHQPSAQDTGTCTCGDTLHVTVTSSNTSYTWSSNYWDQTSSGRHGVLNLIYTAAVGVDMAWTARIVSNTSLVAGGTSVLTLDSPLPHLNFNRYTITGLNQTDGSVVWRKYKIVNTGLWLKVTALSTFPQPFINPGGGVTLTSTPIGAVLWPISGSSPPYNMFPLPFVYDGNGRVYFAEPTYIVAQNAAPADVWVLLPVNTNPNAAVAPADVGGAPQYSGTSRTVEGISDTLTVNVPQWRDPANLANMQAYAAEILDAVKDTVVEGGITYLGLFQAGLTPGLKASVTGDSYTTGWESAALPIVECSLTWNPQGPTSWTTMLTCSSRRSYLGAEAYLRPARSFVPLGAATDPFMGSQAAYGQALHEQASGVLGGLISATQFTGEIPTTPAEALRAAGAPASLGDLGIATPQFVTPEAGRQRETPDARRERIERAQSQHAADVAQANEEREALPRGGLVSGAPSEAVMEQGQEQRAKDQEQAADITRRERARAQRAREDVTSSAPRIHAEGLAQREKELQQGREIGTREQGRARLGHERGRELAEDERQRARDSAEVQEKRGQEMMQEQRDIAAEKQRRRDEEEA